MNATLDVTVRLTDEEKAALDKAGAILVGIQRKIQDYRDNGHYPFIDSTFYPPEFMALKGVMNAIEIAENGEPIVTETIEVCPHCEMENVYPNYNVEANGYVATCKGCGKQIMLCDECMHSDDNPTQHCDWESTPFGGRCFRGETKNKLQMG